VSIDPVICDGGSSRCSDDLTAVIDCSRDGTNETRSVCDADARCVLAEGAASCAALICAPNEVACIDTERAALCDSTGTSFTELPCRADQFCDDGVCRVEVCEPSSVVCDGDSVVACDALGGEATVTACAGTVECSASAFGCACVDGACEPRACVGGTSRCAGNGVQTCDAAGMGYGEVAACTGGDVCVAGACLPTLCEAGTRDCVGDAVVACNVDGTSRTTTDCTETAQVCSTADGSARCVARACVPDVVACDASGFAVVACNSRGSAQTTTPCAVENYCTLGVCLPQVCEPNEVRCAAGDVYTCDSRGASDTLTNECSTRLGCNAGACVVGCGDGILQAGESCDDGNLDDTDECHNTCRLSDSALLGQNCLSDSDCGEDQWCPPFTWDRRCSPIALASTTTAMRFAYVPAGTFSMGSDEPGESPIHDVTVSAFYMATTEVTQGQWTALGFTNPSFFNRVATPNCAEPTCPVDRINWWEAVWYANSLSAHEGLEQCYSIGTTSGTLGGGCAGTSCSDGAFQASSIGFVGRSCTGYRLASEAEWERAGRGGTTSTYTWGESIVTSVARQYAWYDASAGGRTHPVGQLLPNDFGLYDTTGNLHEWVWDHIIGYTAESQIDPFGPASYIYRGGRGGSWTDAIAYIRPAYRFYSIPANRSNYVGMRLVRSAP
jgi:cysteine-rich repeat protein